MSLIIILLVLVIAGSVSMFILSGVTALLWTLLIGFITGAIARFFSPGAEPGGAGITILVGIGGSMAATLIGRLLNFYRPGQSAGFIASILGAVLVLAIYKASVRR